ncbi:MAG: Lrp/AsnC ligand binding domain-containing protein [Methyloligellaceae bacterium]
MTFPNLDEIDRKILNELQSNGRISVVELSNRVNLTKTPCAERLRRLERNGVIEGYRAELNPAALEASYISFVQISLEQTTTEMFEKFYEAVNRIPEIQSCHMVAGGFDYLLKIRTRDVTHYRAVLGEHIATLPGVQQTHTYVVMETVKDETNVPIPKRA